jgi:hypothetical protein
MRGGSSPTFSQLLVPVSSPSIRIYGHRAPAPRDAGGRQRLIVYVDRTGLEVFARHGLAYVPIPRNLAAGNRSLEARTSGDSIRLNSLEVYALRSIWERDNRR